MSRNKKRKGRVVKMMPRITPEKYIRSAARKLPIKKTLISEGIFDSGLGHVFIVREKRNGDLVVGIYMIDVFACGVKDCFFKIIDENEFNIMISAVEENGMKLVEHDPNYVFNLVYGAVEYAEDLGIKPHKDFELISYILDDVEDIDFVDIEFGKNGRPLYAEGMNDNVAKILSALDKSVGVGNYDYVSKKQQEIEIDEEEFIGELIEELSEEGKGGYYYYSIIATEFMDYVSGDIETLKEHWHNNSDTLLESVMNKLVSHIGNTPEELISHYKELKELNLAIIENIIFNNGIDFLNDPMFINSFKDRDNMELFDEINKIAFSIYGKDKVNYLFNIIAVLIDDWNNEEPDKYLGDPMQPYAFYRDYRSGKFVDFELFLELSYATELLIEYDEKIMPITEDMVGDIEI